QKSLTPRRKDAKEDCKYSIANLHFSICHAECGSDLLTLSSSVFLGVLAPLREALLVFIRVIRVIRGSLLAFKEASMFGKILIANGGESAAGFNKTAGRMGTRPVAVYPEAARDARHVELADEAVCIGPPPSTASYLAIDNILAACRQTGAEAVHPGYGFLSEK